MTVRAPSLTPHALLSAPRRSPGVPNPSGTKALYTVSSYNFSTHSKTVEFRSLDISTSESTLLTSEDGVSDPVWVSNSTFLVLKSGKEGGTSVLVGKDGEGWDNAYEAGSIGGAAGNLKVAKLEGGEIAVVVSAAQDGEGQLWDAKKRETYSSGRLYKGLFVRHWDEYEGVKGRNTLWYTVLKEEDGKWGVKGKWRNLMKGWKGSKLEGLETPVRPFGGTDDFDVSSTGIAFVSKDPERDPALNTTCDVYVVNLKSFEEDAPEPEKLDLPGYEGSASSPVFAPNGNGIAFLKMRTNGYESDRNTMFVMLDVYSGGRVSAAIEESAVRKWDRSPSSLAWGPSEEYPTLYFTAEEYGYNKIFYLTLHKNFSPYPKAITSKGSVSSVVPLADGRVFFSSTSLIDNSTFGILEIRQSASSSSDPSISTTWTHSLSKSGSNLGLKESQVSSILTPASNPTINDKVHSWVYRPSFYSSDKKYPLALLIHGGPQGAWTDAWSTRWNPAIFAEQGYIVIAPNPTGSTGYGQAFTDAIRKNWGGDPYKDICNVFEYISSSMPDVDTSNAVALGASYGGYMINWINGHDLGRKFKAMVCHDGIFSVNGLLATEELYFPFYDLGGLPFYNPESPHASSPPPLGYKVSDKEAHARKTFGAESIKAWAENDPSRHLHKWQTPTLVVHSSKDYRLCISEGLSAFNVLQARGVESQLLTFPDENHWVLKPENSLVWHKAVLNWINGFVGLEKYAEEEGEQFFGGAVKEGQGQGEGEQKLLAFGNPTT
ncbi:Beige 1 [Elsinoe australis]|uniref:Dipeptidyl-peptidase V n=1 Tax=Elsinoe australis TaxID=40998 RepID=A0A2P8AE10_9PEZI|nr:Beige 1 [Elsinoe australis]